MELVQVKIMGLVITSQYGALQSGDVLRTSKEFAKHLVDDCKAAEYIISADPAVEVKPVKRRK